ARDPLLRELSLDCLGGGEMREARSAALRLDENAAAVFEPDTVDAADSGIEEVVGRDSAAKMLSTEAVNRMLDSVAVIGAEDVADDVGEIAPSPKPARDERV